MSDQAIITVVAVAASGGVALATALFTFLSQRLQRAEKYRIGLYEQRLAAYQRAVRWLVALQGVAFHSPPLEEDRRVEYQKMFHNADEWWQDNCLYLNPESAEALRRLFLEVGAWAVFGASLQSREASEYFNQAWRVLWKGMGWKHVDPGVAREGLK